MIIEHIIKILYYLCYIMRKNFLLVVLLILMVNIVFAENITLVTDEYWELIIARENNAKNIHRIKNFFRNIFKQDRTNQMKMYGVNVEKIILNFEDFTRNKSEILKIIALSENRIIVLCPLLSDFVEIFATECPQKDFIIVSEKDKEYLEYNNIYAFRYDYLDAMFEAGKIVAKNNLATIAIFYNIDSLGKNEQTVFEDGWKSVKDSEELAVLNLQKRHFIDGSYMKKVEETMNTDAKKQLAVVFANEWTLSIIESMELQDLQIIAKNLKNWSNSIDNTAYGSIEISATKMLSTIIRAISKGSYKSGGVVAAEYIIMNK